MIPRVVPLLLAMMTAVWVTGTPGRATAQNFRQMTDHPSADDVTDHHPGTYVAIMGEVEHPGTYRVEPSELNLHSIVRYAHGFREHASMAIRIVRRGHLSQTVIFSDQSNSHLLADDLLIVESKAPPTPSGKIASSHVEPPSVTRADYHESNHPEAIQIALINLKSYPVVLQLHRDEANANRILESLDQPHSLLSRTHIITPDVPRRQSSDDAKQATVLQNCSVMVFEPKSIRSSRHFANLPALINLVRDSSPSTNRRSLLDRHQEPFQQITQYANVGSLETAEKLGRSHNDVILIPCEPSSPDSRFSDAADGSVFGQFRPAFAAKLADKSMQDATPLLPYLPDSPSRIPDDSLASAPAPAMDEESEPAQPERSFTHLFMIVLSVSLLVAAALTLRHTLEARARAEQQEFDRQFAVDSAKTQFAQRAEASEESMTVALFPHIAKLPTQRAPLNRHAVDLGACSTELRQFSLHPAPEDVTSQEPEAPREILQMQHHKPDTTVPPRPILQLAPNLELATETPPVEPSTIPFRRSPENVGNSGPAANNTPAGSVTMKPAGKSVAEVAGEDRPTPLADALLQLERIRQS